MFELEETLWWYAGMRAISESILARHIEHRNGMRMLDVGCGTGYSIAWLRERFGLKAAFGVDLSPHAAEFWRFRGIDTAAIASVKNLPFGDCEFDLVTCFDVLYQLDEYGTRFAAAEIARVLRPDGLLLTREPAYDWMRGSHDVAVATDHRFTRRRLTRIFRSAGLKALHATYANTLLFGLAVPHRLVSRLKGGSDSDVRPVAPLLNRVFRTALRLEARMLPDLSFPFGLSVVVLAQKLR
jgi:SAM-dependent methyltransferase